MTTPSPSASSPWRLTLSRWAALVGRATLWLGVALVALPSLLIAGGVALAPLRYFTGLPMVVCAVALLFAGAAAAYLAVGRVRLPSLTLSTLWAVCAAMCAWWLYDLLWVEETLGLLTVGGGDAGHHMGISQQLATTHPKVYVGQTGVHATAWLIGEIAGLELPVAMAWAWISGAAFFYAATLGAVAFSVRDLPTSSQLVAIPLAAGLMVQVSAPYVPLVLHYYQAEGFFAHLHGLVPIGLCLLAAASFDRWWMRLLALVAAVGLLRFTYALNLSEGLIALAVTALTLVPWRRPKALAAVLPLAALALWGAWIAGEKLWALRKMSGGIMSHDLYLETVVLGVLTTVAATLALSARAGGFALKLRSLHRLGAVALWLTILGLGPWLVHRHWDDDLSLPRQYYYRKHATLALMALSVGVPAVAAGLAAHITRRFVAASFAVLCIAAVDFSERVLVKQAGGGKRIAMSYRERVDPRVRWRINTPLWEPRAMAQMRAVLWRERKAFGGYSHPSWPVHSVMNSAFPRWRPTEFQTVVDIKERRWQEWHRGFAPQAGTCRFFSAGPGQKRAYAAHDRRRKASSLPYIRGLMRRPDVRCWRWRPPRPELPMQKLCWVCDS